MRISGIGRTAALAAAGLVVLTGCGNPATGDGVPQAAGGGASAATGLKRIPEVGAGLLARIPDESRQIVAVYGTGSDSAESTIVLYAKHGSTWDRQRSWAGHNGKRGWTTDHHEGDKRSPVGVFTLSDAGGLLPAPEAELPYTRSSAFATPRHWPKTHRHDFDHVIAIDYNRVKGTSPLDPTRPQGQSKGGGIWLHLDHGSGTSGCVSLPGSAMAYLLRTLDPEAHPVVVMGDKRHLAG